MSKVILLAGLGYGDEGKGSVVDFLTASEGAHLVVRYSGGSQAAHNVVLDDGRHHTFAQFGSGALQGAHTHLSRFMCVDPVALIAEGEHLISLGVPAFDRITIDRECPLITPYHKGMNRLRERARGERAHGTCGMGVGETVVDHMNFGPEKVPLVGDLENPTLLKSKLQFIYELKREQAKQINIPTDYLIEGLLVQKADCVIDLYAGFLDQVELVDHDFLGFSDGTVIFEGAQGVLLDQWYGFHPYSAWTNTTFRDALKLLWEARFTGNIERMGVTRTYATRHGPGPFPTEGRANIEEAHNDSHGRQGAFRTGTLDLVAMKYAVNVLGAIDSIAVTHMDKVVDKLEYCQSYTIRDHSGDLLAESKGFFSNIGREEIIVRRPYNPAYQERLTRTLLEARPAAICLCDNDPRVISGLLRDATGARASILSYGPRTGDKKPLDN